MKQGVRKIRIANLVHNEGQIEGLPTNPRKITDEKKAKLVQSLKDDPEMLQLRELLVYEFQGKFVVICGNQRLDAAKELGMTELPCKIIPPDTPMKKLRAYATKDNISYGEFDWELLDAWDREEMEDWGVDFPEEVDEEEEKEAENPYTMKIDAPIYTPNDERPDFEEMYSTEKRDELVARIKRAKIDAETRKFLLEAANRHIVFNYSKIADFYCNAPKEVQELMESSCLVIIDYGKAIEEGYVEISEGIRDAMMEDVSNEEV